MDSIPTSSIPSSSSITSKNRTNDNNIDIIPAISSSPFIATMPFQIPTVSLHLPLPLLMFALVSTIATLFITPAHAITASDTALLSSLDKAHNASLYWGTYRPNLYFGTRTREKQSILTGLMWMGAHDYQSFEKIRHTCEQGDELAKYGWLKHDGRNYGLQTIRDKSLNLELKTEYVKLPAQYGNGWAARISGSPIHKSEAKRPVSLVFYAGVDSDDGFVHAEPLTKEQKGYTSPVFVNGSDANLGSFSLTVVESTTETSSPVTFDNANKDASLFHILTRPVPKGQTWKAKEFLTAHLLTEFQSEFPGIQSQQDLPNPLNLFVMKDMIARHEFGASKSQDKIAYVQKVFQPPFSFDVVFLSNENASPTVQDGTRVTDSLDAIFKQQSKGYEDQFESVFKLKAKGYSKKEIRFAQAAHGNLVGGIGYFYGSWLLDTAEVMSEAEENDEEEDSSTAGEDDDDESDESTLDSELKRVAKAKSKQAARPKNVQTMGPSELFSAVPSRPFFPRGFLWDEGFHQALIGMWDQGLSVDILTSWANLIDDTGYVAREQILGDEARSKVPAEFQVQYPKHANPPTLLIPVLSYLDRLQQRQSAESDMSAAAMAVSNDGTQFAAYDTLSDPSLVRDRHLVHKPLAFQFLHTMYDRLKRRYEWFRATHKGDFVRYKRKSKSKEGYRWRGRMGIHTLTSGLDDYPRTQPPSTGELHVDLLSWMAWYAKGLDRIAGVLLELMEETSSLSEKHESLKPTLEQDRETYAKQIKGMLKNLDSLHWDEDEQVFCDVDVNRFGKSIRICHKGYVSLFPLMLELVPADSEKWEGLLSLINDPEHIWTPWGLRSLSKQDEYFNTNENYWRGPIWMNMNWFVCKALHKYSKQEGPYQQEIKDTYTKLRENLVKNVFEEYKRTGFIWEQYSGLNGKGQRSHPFTGWTALVVSLMSETY